MSNLLWYLFWQFWEIARRKFIFVHVGNFNDFWVCSFHSYQTIFFNCCWKDTISFIINMLSNNVDSSWSSSYEIRFRFIFECEGVENGLESSPNIFRIIVLDLGDGHVQKHILKLKMMRCLNKINYIPCLVEILLPSLRANFCFFFSHFQHANHTWNVLFGLQQKQKLLGHHNMNISTLYLQLFFLFSQLFLILFALLPLPFSCWLRALNC